MHIRYATLPVILSYLLAFFGCTDEVPPISPEEQYTRDFVKEFGVFKAESWSEARSGAVTVKTDRPTAVNVFAEIGGQRFIFASLGSVNGTQPIVINVPKSVREVIVQAGNSEYKTALGSVLDLTRGGRAIADIDYSPITSLDGFQVTHEPTKGQAVWQEGRFVYRDYLNGKLSEGGFRINNKSNFALNEGLIYNSSFFCFNSSTSNPWMRIYPLYWKENKYGESDYLLGVYFYNENDPTHIEMHDLEGFDIRNGVVVASDFDSWTVSTGSEAYDYKSLENKGIPVVRMKGTRISFNKNPDREKYPYCIGFYLKSGLKEGYTENKGRNFTHISFQNIAHNADFWRGNFWDVALKNCGFAYTGAALNSGSVSVSPMYKDGTQTPSGDSSLYALGFGSQPDGVDSDLSDCSDAIFLISMAQGATAVKPISHKGETFGLYPWYLAAEDLGATDDWDFNDLVVNVYDITTDLTRTYTSVNARYPTPDIIGRRIIVEPRAAGGTMPIYLMYEGEVSRIPTDDEPISALNANFTKGTYVIGTELHSWLGEPDWSKMLNTGQDDGHCGRAVSFCIPVAKEGTPAFDPLTPPQDLGDNNQTMRGFWVLVDKEDKLYHELLNLEFDPTPLEDEYVGNSLHRRVAETQHAFKPFSGSLGDGVYRVDAPINDNKSIAPQMLMCHYSWRWCLERVNIANAYTSFSAWIRGERKQWHNNDATADIGQGENGYYQHMLYDAETPSWKE